MTLPVLSPSYDDALAWLRGDAPSSGCSPLLESRAISILSRLLRSQHRRFSLSELRGFMLALLSSELSPGALERVALDGLLADRVCFERFASRSDLPAVLLVEGAWTAFEQTRSPGVGVDGPLRDLVFEADREGFLPWLLPFLAGRGVPGRVARLLLAHVVEKDSYVYNRCASLLLAVPLPVCEVALTLLEDAAAEGVTRYNGRIVARGFALSLVEVEAALERARLLV